MKVIYTDGASRGNPGPSAIAYLPEIWGMHGEFGGILDGVFTNNEAEYIAVYEALNHTSNTDVEIISDSKLVMKQLSGEWRVKEPRLMGLVNIIKDLIASKGMRVKFTWKTRSNPMLERADALCNEFLDGRSSHVIQDPRTAKNSSTYYSWTVGKLAKELGRLRGDLPVIIRLREMPPVKLPIKGKFVFGPKAHELVLEVVE